MGYYIRVLGLKNNPITQHDLKQIQQVLKENDEIEFDFVIESENSGDIRSVIIKNKKGDELAQLVKDTKNGNLLNDEIEEFKEEIEDYVPEANYNWLNDYFDKIEVIYAFQVLRKGFEPKNWEIIYALHNIIWEDAGGIWQSDEGQFSNEDGSVIMANWDNETSLKDAKDTQVAILKNDTWDTFEISSSKNLTDFINA